MFPVYGVGFTCERGEWGADGPAAIPASTPPTMRRGGRLLQTLLGANRRPLREPSKDEHLRLLIVLVYIVVPYF